MTRRRKRHVCYGNKILIIYNDNVDTLKIDIDTDNISSNFG